MNDQKTIQRKDYLEKVKLFTNLKDEKVQSYITLIFTFASLIFFGLFAISPTLGTIAALRRELSDAQTIDNSLEEKINNLSTLQQLYSTMKTDIPLLLAAIPQTPEAPRFLAQIQRVANDAGVTMTVLNAGATSITGGVPLDNGPLSFTYEVSAHGTVEQLKTFYTNLSKIIRISTFDTLAMSFTPETNNYTLVIKGKVYFKQ